MNFRSISLFVICFVGLAIFHLKYAAATSEPEKVPQKAGIIEHLETKIDLDLKFEKDDGTLISLADFFNKGKPVIIAPVYFECPRLCTLTQSGLLNSILESDLRMGSDYTVLSVSFNDKETSKQSSSRAAVYREKFPKENKNIDPSSWTFLTGSKQSVEKLMEQLGFKYEYDQGEYMHAAGIIFLTPDGRISRYLYGIEHRPNDFKLALVEAGQGKIGSYMHQALMFCFRYDHIKGQYTLAIWEIIRIVSSIIAVIVIAYFVYLRIKEKKINKLC